MTIVMITDWKGRDQVTDQELVGHNATTTCAGRNNCLSLTSDHHSRARDADINLFQPEFVMNYVSDILRNWS